MTSQLTLKTMAQVSPETLLPNYRPTEHRSGIVHLGAGAFHRAHQAAYTDDLLAMHGGYWRITAVSLRSPSVRDKLASQNYLYTLSEKSNVRHHIRVIGAIERILVAPDDPEKVIEVLADPLTKIVTLTVTEKGYCHAQKSDLLDFENTDIAADLKSPEKPKSMPGFLSAAFARRMARGLGGLTILSCDNLPNNGRILGSVVLEFTSRSRPEVVSWIKEHVTFCNTVVDRIVPATTDQDISDVSQKLGLCDKGAVLCEPYRQWIIEDNFCTERPRWEDVGATFVKDVAPFEAMKLRLLNGSHSILAYLGHLTGHQYIHQAIQTPALEHLITRFMDKEVSPTLGLPAGYDLEAYKEAIKVRFANAQIHYGTQQVASDGSKKILQRWLSTAEDLIDMGGRPAVIAFSIAGWFRYLEASDELNRTYKVIDPMAQALTRIAQQLSHEEERQVTALVEATGIFSPTLCGSSVFIKDIIFWLTQMHQEGLDTALTNFLNTVDKS